MSRCKQMTIVGEETRRCIFSENHTSDHLALGGAIWRRYDAAGKRIEPEPDYIGIRYETFQETTHIKVALPNGHLIGISFSLRRREPEVIRDRLERHSLVSIAAHIRALGFQLEVYV